MTSPQQPTQEALTWAKQAIGNLVIHHGFGCIANRLEEAEQELANRADRFAAQRVTDLQRERDSETLRAQGANEALNDLIRERDAAVGKARREAIEECAHFVESGIFLTDSSPAYHFARECAAAIRRALTSQNPGDAAPQEDAEK